MSDDSVYSDDGEYLGEMMEAEDGAKVLIDETGEIVAAVDTEGNPLDPAGYTMADDDGGYDETDDLRDQIEELREWTENFDPIAMREEARAMGQAASGHLADEAWSAATGREIRNLEARLGRDLTQTEVWRILEEHRGDFEHGIPSDDIGPAVERAGIIGFSPGRDIGLSDHQHGEARRAFMAELVGDGEREERGEDPGDRPWHEPASDNPHDVRVSQMMNTIDHPED